VVFSHFLFTTTTDSELSQGLGRQVRGCVVVVVVAGTQDDDKQAIYLMGALIEVCVSLLQTKVNLFWNREQQA